MSILIVCCPEDTSIQYGYYYLRSLADHLAKKHKVVFLRTAILSTLYDALVKFDPRLVILNGHGGSKGIKGCNENVILGIKNFDPDLNLKIQDENPSWMSDRIVYLFTCNCGKELAPALIQHGASAVVAFDRPFIFTASDSGPPDNDSYPSFISALQFPLGLDEGKTAGEAFNDMKNSFLYYVTMMEEQNNILTAKYLFYNYNHARFFGDTHAKL